MENNRYDRHDVDFVHANWKVGYSHEHWRYRSRIKNAAVLLARTRLD